MLKWIIHGYFVYAAAHKKIEVWLMDMEVVVNAAPGATTAVEGQQCQDHQQDHHQNSMVHSFYFVLA